MKKRVRTEIPFLYEKRVAEGDWRALAAHRSGLFPRPFRVGSECDKGKKGLRMREGGCERGESDRFTLFLIKDQAVGISCEGVKVKSEKN